MATIAETPQDHRPTTTPVPVAANARRRWWQISGLPAAVVAAALAIAVGLGAWGVSLNNQLVERDAALRTVASADAIYAASGSAGAGWVLPSGGQAMFMAEVSPGYPPIAYTSCGSSVLIISRSRWERSPTPRGVILVTLERELGDAATFAVTIEAERVDEPTTDPILVTKLDA